jgi:hypothetical protein
MPWPILISKVERKVTGNFDKGKRGCTMKFTARPKAQLQNGGKVIFEMGVLDCRIHQGQIQLSTCTRKEPVLVASMKSERRKEHRRRRSGWRNESKLTFAVTPQKTKESTQQSKFMR